jgi:hypothetical protein
MPDVTNPDKLPSFHVCMMFLTSLSLCGTSFLTRSVQAIFSILLQHHISKLFAKYDVHSHHCKESDCFIHVRMHQEPIRNIQHKLRRPILGDNIKNINGESMWIGIVCHMIGYNGSFLCIPSEASDSLIVYVRKLHEFYLF